MVIPIPTTLDEKASLRFWAKVGKADGCWFWMGTRGSQGYGLFRLNQKTAVRAHRLMWTLAYGPIPDDLHVLHHCDNPACVRIDHLFLGTDADNVHDKINKGRDNSPRGEDHVHTKFTSEQIRMIRKDAQSSTLSGRAIARKYGACYSAIRAIINRNSWKHIA